MNDEFRSAKALHAFVNANRDPKKHRGEIPLKEFLPDYLQDNTPKPAVHGDQPAAAPVDPRAQKAAEAKMKALQGAFS